MVTPLGIRRAFGNVLNMGRLVIVAEDEAMLRLIVVQNLEDCGFDVLACANGLEALNQAKMHPECRLLVSDVRMPVMDGYDLASKVLSLEPHPPIMLLTGYSDPLPEDLRNRITLLHKPIAMEELCDRARSLCGDPDLRPH
jgi:CheY-like chemotaxis protein